MTDPNAVFAEIRGARPFATDADKQNAFKAVFFGTEDGRRVLAELVGLSGYHAPLVPAGDPYHFAFREGMRQGMVNVVSILAADPTEETRIELTEKDPHDG